MTTSPKKPKKKQLPSPRSPAEVWGVLQAKTLENTSGSVKALLIELKKSLREASALEREGMLGALAGSPKNAGTYEWVVGELLGSLATTTPHWRSPSLARDTAFHIARRGWSLSAELGQPVELVTAKEVHRDQPQLVLPPFLDRHPEDFLERSRSSSSEVLSTIPEELFASARAASRREVPSAIEFLSRVEFLQFATLNPVTPSAEIAKTHRLGVAVVRRALKEISRTRPIRKAKPEARRKNSAPSRSATGPSESWSRSLAGLLAPVTRLYGLNRLLEKDCASALQALPALNPEAQAVLVQPLLSLWSERTVKLLGNAPTSTLQALHHLATKAGRNKAREELATLVASGKGRQGPLIPDADAPIDVHVAQLRRLIAEQGPVGATLRVIVERTPVVAIPTLVEFIHQFQAERVREGRSRLERVATELEEEARRIDAIRHSDVYGFPKGGAVSASCESAYQELRSAAEALRRTARLRGEHPLGNLVAGSLDSASSTKEDLILLGQAALKADATTAEALRLKVVRAVLDGPIEAVEGLLGTRELPRPFAVGLVLEAALLGSSERLLAVLVDFSRKPGADPGTVAGVCLRFTPASLLQIAWTEEVGGWVKADLVTHASRLLDGDGHPPEIGIAHAARRSALSRLSLTLETALHDLDQLRRWLTTAS